MSDVLVIPLVDRPGAGRGGGSLAVSSADVSGRDVVVMCGHGEQAATAASVLERAGGTGVAIRPGGLQDRADAATGRAPQVYA